MTNKALEKIESMVKESGSATAVAKTLRISPSLLSEIRSGSRGLSQALLSRMGFTRIEIIVPNKDVKKITSAIREAE